ncbi:c-type cytochrome [Spirosoma fluminis]
MNALRKIGKWLGLGLLTLIVLGSLAYGFVAYNISQRSQKTYSFARETLSISPDSTTLKKGEHLATIKGCIECHGANLAGKMMIDDPALGRLVASNLTKGKGGLPADYSTADWLIALRHGIDRSGRPLLFMPSHESTLLAEADLQALIAYCQQAPAVDHILPSNDLGPVVNIMAYLDKMPLLSVEKIDHTKPIVAHVDTTEGVAQGKYLAVSCTGCHQPSLKGGEPLVPGQPPVPDITRTGNVGRWTQAQFVNTLRTGKTPKGHQISNDDMPWKMTAQYSDKELASLYRYFRSIQ